LWTSLWLAPLTICVVVRSDVGFAVKPDGKTLRFYKNVGIDKLDFGYALKLGGRFVLTPSHRLFVVPTEHIAYAVAHEWDSQQRTIKPGTMPIVRLSVCVQVPSVANAPPGLASCRITSL